MRQSSLIDRSVVVQLLQIWHDYVRPDESIRMIMRPVVHLRTTVARLVETSISCAMPYDSHTYPLATLHNEKGRGQLLLNSEHVKKSAATCLRSISLARLPATSAIDRDILLRSPTIPSQFRSQPVANWSQRLFDRPFTYVSQAFISLSPVCTFLWV